MKDNVGIGIIGTGFARKVQIPAFLAAKSCEIISVASGSLTNAQTTADEFGIGHFTDNWRETGSHDNVDLVCITTPPNLHKEMTLFALEHGKHVLCEKPMAMNVAEAHEMMDAAKGKSLLALIDHELRFQPGRQKAFEMLRSGGIGKIRHAKYSFQAPHRGDPNLPWNWWSDIGQGGGALGAINSHIIDSFHWFLGTEISNVFCQLQTHIKERRDASGQTHPVTTDDEANMLLRFADSDLTSDATGIVSVSMTEGPRYKNRIEFYGNDGAMRIDHRGDVFTTKAGEDDWREIDVEMGKIVEGVADTGFSRGFMNFAPEIIKAIREGRTAIENAAAFEDGLKIQKILDAARESNSTNCTVIL
ncbi:MAG: Gfo/Idh/MocA family oxidoreductase [Acidobacteriota bacterium]|nr:Gfo/Idh/MocA family oxidoreductase [Acidobacteriota bacterium]